MVSDWLKVANSTNSLVVKNELTIQLFTDQWSVLIHGCQKRPIRSWFAATVIAANNLRPSQLMDLIATPV